MNSFIVTLLVISEFAYIVEFILSLCLLVLGGFVSWIYKKINTHETIMEKIKAESSKIHTEVALLKQENKNIDAMLTRIDAKMDLMFERFNKMEEQRRKDFEIYEFKKRE